MTRLITILALVLGLLLTGAAQAQEMRCHDDTSSTRKSPPIMCDDGKVYNYIMDGEGNTRAAHVDSDGALKVDTFEHVHLDAMESATPWTIFGNDTTGLAVTTNHVEGQYAIGFNKVDGAANTIYAGCSRLITSTDLTEYVENSGIILGSYYLSALTNVAYVFIRAGTDASNYTEWRVDDDNMVAGWNAVAFRLAEPAAAVTGTGMIHTAVTWIAVGVAFDAESDALASIAVDHINLVSGQNVTTNLQTSINTPNVNIHRVAGTPVGETNPLYTQNIFPTWDDDATGNCKAITAASVQHTMASNDAVRVCANGGTAYLLWGTNPTATTAVGNFSMIVGDGQCIGPYETAGAKVAVIGSVAAGFVCFHALDYQ